MLDALGRKIIDFVYDLIDSGTLDTRSIELARAVLVRDGLRKFEQDERFNTREKAKKFVAEIVEPMHYEEVRALSKEERNTIHFLFEHYEQYEICFDDNDMLKAFLIEHGIRFPVEDERYNTPLKAAVFIATQTINRANVD